ncbi:MAG: Cna B-type domain-containing protein, partial [Clostridia bacterium]|nr:Cna B-type domain-containing protein [Clostridia bacterium]
LGGDGTLPAASYTLYEVIDGEEQEILTALSNQTSGAIRFTAITYTQDDVGTHTYVLRERDGGNDMVAYDEREYVIQVQVEDLGDGTLAVSKQVTLDGEKTEEILFADEVNHTCLTIQKWVTGETTTQVFRFTVILRVDGEELTGSYPYRGSRTGTITSGGTIELASGDNVTIENLPEGVHYRVIEDECPRYRVIVNGQDTMTAEGEASGEEGELLEFTSSLIATTFTVYKQWVGVQGGKIRLIMYSDGVEMVPQPTVNWSGNSNTYTVDGLPKYTYGGRRIIYTAKEAYMSGYMTDYRNLEGLTADCAYDGCTIVNTAVKQMRVHGVFTGVAENEKLPEIGLTIFRANGTELKHIEVSPDRKGWLNIYNLPLGYDYYVVADQMEGFRTTYLNAEDGTHAEDTDKVWENGTITNHRIAKTGDSRPIEVWIFVLLASLIGMVVLYVTGKKRAMNR